MMNHTWRLLLVSWVELGLLICASAPTLALAQTPTPTPDEPKTSGGEYIISPGDSLEVFVWHHPDLTVTVQARPDGKISTPLVEDMVAVGKTPQQLARDMEKVLSELVSAPRVNIILPVNARAVTVVVHGQSTSMTYRDGMRVLDAIRVAGWEPTFAYGDQVRIVHTERGKKTIIYVRNEDDLKQNPLLQPFDVVVVAPQGSVL